MSPTILTINFLVSLSVLCSSPNGHCWVHIGYVKTGKANWFVALRRLASDRRLAQIIESHSKYGFAASVNANFTSSQTLSHPGTCIWPPILRLSTKAVSSRLDFATSSTCLPFLTWVTLQFSGSTANPYPA